MCVCVRVYVCVEMKIETGVSGEAVSHFAITPNTIKLNQPKPANQSQPLPFSPSPLSPLSFPSYLPLPLSLPHAWQNFLGGLFGDISSGGEGWTALRYDVSTTPHSLRPLQNSPSPPSLGLLLVVTNFELTQGSALLFDHTGRQP